MFNPIIIDRKNMKRIIMGITMMLTLTMMSSCITKENAENGESGNVKTKVGVKSAAANATHYDFDGFSILSLSGIVHAVVRQGERYAIEVDESPNHIIKTFVEIKGDRLTVYTKTKESDIQKDEFPTVYVTLPTIKGLEADGATNACISNLNVGDMKVGLSGASHATFDDMKCGNLDVECSGAVHLGFGKVKCESLKVALSGAVTLTLAADANGSIDIDNSGACQQNLQLSGKTLKMENNGACKSDVTFKGISANVFCSGVGKVKLDVDCEELKARNSGASTLTISGTADKTDINADGAATINTKQLNQL